MGKSTKTSGTTGTNQYQVRGQAKKKIAPPKMKMPQDAPGRLEIARNPQTTSAMLAALAQDRDAKIRQAVAGHPNCPLKTLAELSCDDEWKVRLAAVSHPKCPGDALRWRAEWVDEETGYIEKDSDVLQAVASHPNTPEYALVWLGWHEDMDVRLSVLESPKCSWDEIEACFQDRMREWDTYIKEYHCSPDVMTALAQYADEHDHNDVRQTIAKQPECPPDLLVEMAADEHDDKLRQFVAEHPKCPPNLLIELMQDNWGNVAQSARNAFDEREDIPDELRVLVTLSE